MLRLVKITPQGSKSLQALLHSLDDKRQVLIGDTQRRSHDQYVVNPGCGIAIVAKDKSSFLTSGDESIHHLRINRALALLVLHQLYAEQKSPAADVPHVGMTLQLGQLLAQAFAQQRRAS